MIHPAVAVLLLSLVQLTTQQPPGVPPKQHNQPPHQQQHNQPPQHHQQQQQQQQQQHQQPQAHEEHGHHGKPLQFASEVHNADHILEHLEKVVATKSKDQMTEEELEFHYFKLHDYDNNNKLDGVEIGKALTHFHDEDQRLEKDERRIVSDRQLSVSVDGALNQLDTSTDGYVDYVEFRRNKNFGMRDTKSPQQNNSTSEDDVGMPDDTLTTSIDSILDTFDANHDGYIEYFEFKKVNQHQKNKES